MKIQVNGKEADFGMNWAAIEILMDKWGFTSVNKTIEKITSTPDDDVDQIIEIISAATGGIFDFKDAGRWLFENKNRLGEIFATIIKDMSDPNPEPDPNPEALKVNGAETVNP